MLYWTDFPPPDEAMQLADEYLTIKTFERLFTRYPLNSLWGDTGISKWDISQSMFLGNCYFIAGIMAFANFKEGLRKVFIN